MAEAGHYPLVRAVREAAERKPAVFHTPGHKRGRWRSDDAVLPAAGLLWSWDGGDAVWSPVHRHRLAELIEEAGRLAARVWGAERTWLLWNGATAGVLAMVAAAVGPGAELVLPREVHRSAIDALVLSGGRPVFVPPRWLEGWELPLPPLARDVAAALADREGSRARPGPAVLAVNPTYYGVCPNLAEMVRVARPRPVLVDEAHGAHLPFYPGRALPHGLASGARLVVHSAHKTLAALTQAALLHLGQTENGDPAEPPASRVGMFLGMLQSTSPQPALLVSLDALRGQLERNGEQAVAAAVEAARQARAGIMAAGPFRCLGPGDLPAPWALDETRLVVDVTGAGLTGLQAFRFLVEEANVWPEMADFRRVVFIFTAADADAAAANAHTAAAEAAAAAGADAAGACGVAADTEAAVASSPVRRLVSAFAALWQAAREGRVGARRPGRMVLPERLPPPGPQVLTPREAVLGRVRRVAWSEACGEVSADLVTPYPPGTPLLVPGERIGAEVVEWARQARACGWELRGIGGSGEAGVYVVDAPAQP